ncbi:NAD(P)H-dependent flavin oxidoreductase [Rhodococcus sp. NPDC057529]|uniref:NAD(P)H-dependent flavin oxidoreductase n=1 Tax=Rhodococcus sp. NPDC057529 TaxID=3346158 RepID=UPI00366E161D
MRLETAATRLLHIDVPVVQAGMSWASSSPDLPIAVSEAGGLGVLAAGPMRIPDLREAILTIQRSTDRPFAVNLPLYRKGIDEAMELLLDLRPPVLIASQGGPQCYLTQFHDVGTTCLHVVASEEHALKAAESGVDGLVVVGGEAGGHPPASLVSTLVLVRAVVRAVPEIPIIASGGFVDGAGLAAALSLGAAAAQFGTRFLASDESAVHPNYKQAVLAAGIGDTRTVGRGLGMIRALTNTFTDRITKLEDSATDIEQRRTEFHASTLKHAAVDGDIVNGKVEAGQTAGLITALLPAADIVTSIVQEYQDATSQLPRVQ